MVFVIKKHTFYYIQLFILTPCQIQFNQNQFFPNQETINHIIKVEEINKTLEIPGQLLKFWWFCFTGAFVKAKTDIQY